MPTPGPSKTPADPADLAHQILEAAQLAGLGEGDRLPTERQLADEYGVSRVGVRHALAQLEAEGSLTRQVGRGTFLRSRDESAGPPTEADLPTDVSPADVMAVRRLLEPSAMVLAVSHATERDLLDLDRHLARGDRASTFAEFETWDIAVHRRLIQSTRNPLLIRLYGSVESARGGPLWGELKRRKDTAERREVYQREHHCIVDAVRSRDADAAVTAMRVHLATVTTVLLGAAV
ncbi:FadR/GntR family transcriptional regulator [Leekyejoonella antrihumi]|uniref:FadR family transcriptional regulator n=1 Tax=Leekyejoonella antrihumi TaxID=1660198 RepID=A0A563DZN3_9MICO|nr:FCD domain-containing protein [Leekyejoonella antrihumi]TWP35720.1 FadR family transcriptional regulator [Leekyejoonella antrihumi]